MSAEPASIDFGAPPDTTGGHSEYFVLNSEYVIDMTNIAVGRP